MQVRLTNKGREYLGWSADRQTATVSDNRAFAMMKSGLAVEDKGFMSLYDGPAESKPEKSKKEKAVSRKSKKREKAVKED